MPLPGKPNLLHRTPLPGMPEMFHCVQHDTWKCHSDKRASHFIPANAALMSF